MSTGNEIKKANGMQHKAAGNEKFKAGDFTGALKEYHFALLHLRGLESGGAMKKSRDPESNPLEKTCEEDVSDMDKDLAVILTNMAACQLRLNRVDRVVSCASDALEANPFNTKAKFRLAQGHIREGALIKAEKLLDELEKQSPGDAAFAAERRNIEVKEKETEGKQRKEFSGMFDRK